jgi:2'-5' RNA ligase
MYIVLLPSKKQIKQIDSLREKVYSSDFRIYKNVSPSESHITITQIEDPSKTKMKRLKSELELIANQSDSIVIPQNKYRIEIQSSDKYSWVGLIIKHKKIDQLKEHIDKITVEIGLDKSSEYLERMPNRKFRPHLNLSNYTRKEKANIVFDMFRKYLPRKIHINRIGLRNHRGEIMWQTELA